MGDSSHLYFANEEVDGNETEYKQYCNGESYYLSEGSETKDHWNVFINNTNWFQDSDWTVLFNKIK